MPERLTQLDDFSITDAEILKRHEENEPIRSVSEDKRKSS